MSDMSNERPEATTPAKADKPKAKRTRKSTPRVTAFTKPATVAQVAQAIAKAKGTDANAEAKKLRGWVRGNFDTLRKGDWKALKQVGKENRDGNRYPPMPAGLANTIVKERTGRK